MDKLHKTRTPYETLIFSLDFHLLHDILRKTLMHENTEEPNMKITSLKWSRNAFIPNLHINSALLKFMV